MATIGELLQKLLADTASMQRLAEGARDQLAVSEGVRQLRGAVGEGSGYTGLPTTFPGLTAPVWEPPPMVDTGPTIFDAMQEELGGLRQDTRATADLLARQADSANTMAQTLVQMAAASERSARRMMWLTCATLAVAGLTFIVAVLGLQG